MSDLPKILVVDDELANRALVSAQLADSYVVLEAADGPEALEILAGTPVDLVLLDVMMPRMSGIDVCRLIKRDTQDGPFQPVILLTALGAQEDRNRGPEAGADDFLTKPVKRDALFSAVVHAAELDALSRQKRQESKSIDERLATLTHREREVLEHVIAGRLNKQIAASLGTVEKTIKVHRGRMMAKLGMRSVAELVRLADRAGITPAGNAP